ncbi:WD40 repeat domain-containing protein [Zavarzinella formosa]|uniref:WD40 repeat domain-containing protein n=1 Tax=Zavarzinella formosa TaxID=360055 RepID=UPI00138AD30A|nr:WD40 repeat domain-containing protein [Zavarzinella formosa]
MLSPEDHDRLLAYLDNQLSVGEAAALEGRLKTEPTLAEGLIRLSRDETVMAEWAATSQPTSDVFPAPDPIAVPVRRPWSRILAGTAAAFVVAFGLWAFFNRTDNLFVEHSDGYAQLQEVEGEAFLVSESGETTPLMAGQQLKPGQQLRTSEGGSAVVLLPFIGRIELGADTTVRILPREAEARVHVEKGIIHADSTNPAAPSPMSFTTPHALIRASGSAVITSGMGNTSTVEMDTGSAKVTSKGDGKTVSVEAGKIAVAKPKGQKPQNVKNVPPRIATPRETWDYPAGPTLAGALLPGGKVFTLTTWDARLVFRDTVTGREMADLAVGKVNPHALSFSADGSLLATGSNDKTPKIRDPQTGKEILALKKQKPEILAVAASPDGKVVATGGGMVQGSAELKIWEAKTGLELATLRGHTGNIEDLKFSPDGRWLASASRDGGARLWNTASWQTTGDVTSHPQGALCVAFTPDSKTLITGGRDGFVRIWDIEKQELKGELDPPPQEIASLAVSSDGRFLAAGVGGTIWIWNLATRQPLQTLAGHRNKVTSVTFSADGKSLYSTGWDRTVKIWEVAGL